MKIVILDGFTENPGDLSWEALEAFGDLTVYDRTPYDDAVIAGRIGDAEVVFTNKCPRLGEGHLCFKRPHLRHCCRRAVCHCPAFGTLPPCGTSFRRRT